MQWMQWIPARQPLTDLINLFIKKIIKKQFKSYKSTYPRLLFNAAGYTLPSQFLQSLHTHYYQCTSCHLYHCHIDTCR